MLNWISNIGASIKALFIGVAITLGIVSAPQMPAPISEVSQEIIQMATATPTPIPTPTPTPTPTKKLEINFIQGSKPTPTPAPKSSQTPTLSPSPTPTAKLTPTISPTLTSSPTPTPSPTPTAITVEPQPALQISDVTISTTRTTALLEWKTNKPVSSKAFISGGALSSNVYTSESGISIHHVIHFTNLNSDTTYTYVLEAIDGDRVEQKEGSFKTLRQSFSATTYTTPPYPVPFIKFSSDAGFTVEKLVFLNDNSYCSYELTRIAKTLDAYVEFTSGGGAGFSKLRDVSDRFTFDLRNSGQSISKENTILNASGLHVSKGDVVFRFAAGYGGDYGTNCTTNGIKITLIGSDSVIIDENGKQINLSNTDLIGN